MVVGVASERDVLFLESQVPASDLLTLLDECAVAGKQLHVVADRTNLIISRENLHNEARLRETFDSRLKGQVRLIDGFAAVSVIGAGINATYRNVRSGLEALSEARIQLPGVNTSSFRITWMVPRERTDEAVRVLHRTFIETATGLPQAGSFPASRLSGRHATRQTSTD
jgi:aspartate kinase